MQPGQRCAAVGPHGTARGQDRATRDAHLRVERLLGDELLLVAKVETHTQQLDALLASSAASEAMLRASTNDCSEQTRALADTTAVLSTQQAAVRALEAAVYLLIAQHTDSHPGLRSCGWQLSGHRSS